MHNTLQTPPAQAQEHMRHSSVLCPRDTWRHSRHNKLIKRSELVWRAGDKAKQQRP